MRLLSNFRPCYFAAAIFVSLFVLKSNSFGIDHFISKTRRENIFLGITNQDCSWLQAKMLSKPLKDLLASGKAQIILGSHQGCAHRSKTIFVKNIKSSLPSVQDKRAIEQNFMLKVISFFEQASKNVGLFLIEPDAMLKDIQALEAFPALLRQARREPYFLPVVYPVQQFVPESLMPFHATTILGHKTYLLEDCKTISVLSRFFPPENVHLARTFLLDSSPEAISLVLQRLLWLQGKTVAVASIQGNQAGRKMKDPATRRKSKDELSQLTLQKCHRVKGTLKSLLSLPKGLQSNCSKQQACLQELAKKVNVTCGGLSLPEMTLPAWQRKVRPQPKFVHMVQGDLLPPPFKNRTTDPALNASDFFRLTFRKTSNATAYDIFYAHSTFSSGRNALLRLALAQERGEGYRYFIFLDDDIDVKWRNESAPRAAPTPMGQFHNFLLTYTPAFGQDIFHWNLKDKPTFEPVELPGLKFDMCLNGFHRQTLGMLLPAVEAYESISFTANIYLRKLLINVPYEGNASLMNTETFAVNLISHKMDKKRDYPADGQPLESIKIRELGIQPGCWTVYRTFERRNGSLSTDDRKPCPQPKRNPNYPNPGNSRKPVDPNYTFELKDRRRFFVEGQYLDRLMNKWLASPLVKPL